MIPYRINEGKNSKIDVKKNPPAGEDFVRIVW
jgi:hypothetical protein